MIIVYKLCNCYFSIHNHEVREGAAENLLNGGNEINNKRFVGKGRSVGLPGWDWEVKDRKTDRQVSKITPLTKSLLLAAPLHKSLSLETLLSLILSLDSSHTYIRLHSSLFCI